MAKPNWFIRAQIVTLSLVTEPHAILHPSFRVIYILRAKFRQNQQPVDVSYNCREKPQH